MTTSNVISLSGAGVPELGRPNDQIIAHLKDMLERAESGEIQAIVFVHLNDDCTTGHGFAGDVVTYSMVGAMHVRAAMMVECLVEDA